MHESNMTGLVCVLSGFNGLGESEAQVPRKASALCSAGAITKFGLYHVEASPWSIVPAAMQCMTKRSLPPQALSSTVELWNDVARTGAFNLEMALV